MDDPQILGHAIQIGAMLLLLRDKWAGAALLFAVSLFIKHNLLALPLAATLWLVWQDWRSGFSFFLWGLAATLALLIAFQLHFGLSLLDAIAAPRLWSFANLVAALQRLWWLPLPLIAMAGLWPDRYTLFCFLYAAIALLFGLLFATGDGVDANVFFDAGIALSLGLGLALDRGRWPLVAAAAALPLMLFLLLRFADNNFFFTRAFRAQSAADIAFLRAHPGPALCEQLSLCLWAGKTAEIDVFNIGEAIKSGARDPAPLIDMLARHRFAALQLEGTDAFGPRVQAAIAQNYRPDHSDDNGSFLIPR
jgi:hypothetical protein